MPSFAPTFTPRYKLRYFGNGKIHSQIWRMPPAAVLADTTTFALFVAGYYAAMAPDLFDDTVAVDASFAAEGSTVFLPCAIPTIIGTGAAGPAPSNRTPKALSFVGRSTAGSRWVLYQYGVDFQIGDTDSGNDFRITTAEETVILDVVGFLNGEFNSFRANDGVGVIVKPYANIKDNDYWVGRARG